MHNIQPTKEQLGNW